VLWEVNKCSGKSDDCALGVLCALGVICAQVSDMCSGK
jgi:hypothetical protein